MIYYIVLILLCVTNAALAIVNLELNVYMALLNAFASGMVCMAIIAVFINNSRERHNVL